MSDLWYKYSGKPKGSLIILPNRYAKLDCRIPEPPRKDVEHRMVYLNISPTWKLPKNDPMYWFQTGVARVRWVRAGTRPDPTAFQTFVLTPWEHTLISHMHWEMGESGRGGWWAVRVRGMLKKAEISTRYSKGFMD